MGRRRRPGLQFPNTDHFLPHVRQGGGSHGEVADLLSGTIPMQGCSQTIARQQQGETGIMQRPLQFMGQNPQADATVRQVQPATALIGMPLSRVQDEDLAGRNGCLAMDRPVQGMTGQDQGDFQEVMVVEGRLALMPGQIDQDLSPAVAMIGPHMMQGLGRNHAHSICLA